MTPRRILLIKLRHHGDVLLTTPLIDALKSRYPDCRIDLLLYKETAPMLSRHPAVDRLWLLDRALRGARGLRHKLGLLADMRRQRYDVVLHLSDQWLGAIISRILAPSVSAAFDYPKRQHPLWHGSFTHRIPHSETRHTVEQNLAALAALDLPVTPRPCTMAINDADRADIEGKLAALGIDGPFIAVHPASRWFFKCWEDDRFAALLDTLAAEGHALVLTGAPDEREMALVAHILQQTTSPRIHSLAGQLSLTTLAALIDRARLFIGVDSVPMHMAAALGKDTVALFGPSKIAQWHPWMTRHILLHAADYGPLIDPDQVDTSTHERYLANIPLAAVLDAVHHLLQEQDAGTPDPR